MFPRFCRSSVALVVFFLALAVSRPLHAQGAPVPQASPQDPAAADAPPSPANPRRMSTTWEDGLVLQTDDSNYRIQLGSMLRFDGRYVPNDPGHVVTDTFTVRAARFSLQGRIAKYVTFRVVPEFVGGGGGIPGVLDAWFDLELSQAVHVHFGRDKTQLGYEALLPDANIVFIERGMTLNLQPLRDVGIQVYGDLPGGVVSYAVGIFNGVVDGTNSTNLDTDSSKDLAGRVVVTPFARTKVGALKGLSLALGGSTGRQVNAGLPTFRTSVQQTYFSYDSSAKSNGDRRRVSPQVYYYFKQLGLYAEYARSTQAVTKGDTTADVSNEAWQVNTSFVLTGETASERVRPRRNFDPEKHQWGALQVMARYGGLSVDPAAFALGFATAGSSRQTNVGSLGAIWYMTANVKVLFNVERSVFDHNPDGPRYAEHAALLRTQLNF